MNYFAPLGLTREPFSNSPDPNFLYDSRQHATCLQQLEIAVRLRRGLSVVVGDIGTGKTTLCRRFVRLLAPAKNVSVHLLLDPYFPTPEAFLRVLFGFFTAHEPAPGLSAWQLKEGIKKALFKLGVKEGRLVVLIVDEGQKLSAECLELLRELLNYETNAQKLLQIVVFAQREIEPVLAGMPNLLDRVNCYHSLRPLNFAETRAMIRFRLGEAAADKSAVSDLFSSLACFAIHRASGGYPRRIVRLCHKVVLELLIRRRTRAGWALVRACVQAERRQVRRVYSQASALLGLFLAACLGVWGLYHFNIGNIRENRYVAGLTEATARVAETAPPPSLLDKAPAEEPPAEVPAAAPQARPEAAKSPSPAEQAAAKPREPELLGTVRLAPGQGLDGLLREVFGQADPDLRALVLAANPGLGPSPAPGAAVRVPVPSADKAPAFSRLLWVQVARAADLDKACAELRRLAPGLGRPLRLLVWRSKAEGTQFAVVLETAFPSEPPALALIGTLPGGLKDEARMLQFGRKEVSFYGRLDEAARRLARAGN